jgi:hypothetical protein
VVLLSASVLLRGHLAGLIDGRSTTACGSTGGGVDLRLEYDRAERLTKVKWKSLRLSE